MGDFGTAVRYLDWVKSRQATLQEAQSAPVPFTKYYNRIKSRAFKKIPYVINIDAHTLNTATDFQYFPRLIFQYKISAPGRFHIVTISEINELTRASGIIAVRYIDNDGNVVRYALNNNGLIGNYRLCFGYNHNLILKDFFLEYWLATDQFDNCGISNDIKLTLGLYINPAFPEEIERPITVEGPFDYPTYSWFIPFFLPQENFIITGPMVPPIITGPFLTDEFGNFIVDEFGNKIVLNI